MVAVRYRLGDRAELARVRAQLTLLDELDDVWTSELEGAGPADVEGQRGELIGLADELHNAILTARDGVERLVGTLQSFRDEDVDAAFAAIAVGHAQLAADFRARLAEVFDEYSLRGFLIDACLFLRDELPGEAEIVVAKRDRLQAGDVELGDMKPATKCALGVAVLGLSIAGIVMTGGAASGMVLSGAASVGAFGIGWDDGCNSVARRIWSRLRD